MKFRFENPKFRILVDNPKFWNENLDWKHEVTGYKIEVLDWKREVLKIQHTDTSVHFFFRNTSEAKS
jgi:hypothetical protein